MMRAEYLPVVVVVFIAIMIVGEIMMKRFHQGDQERLEREQGMWPVDIEYDASFNTSAVTYAEVDQAIEDFRQRYGAKPHQHVYSVTDSRLTFSRLNNRKYLLRCSA